MATGYRNRRPDTVSIYMAAHGYYGTSSARFDQAIEKYLPATFEDLLAQIKERAEGWPIDYSDLRTVTECLFVLSDYDGNNW